MRINRNSLWIHFQSIHFNRWFEAGFTIDYIIFKLLCVLLYSRDWANKQKLEQETMAGNWSSEETSSLIRILRKESMVAKLDKTC